MKNLDELGMEFRKQKNKNYRELDVIVKEIKDFCEQSEDQFLIGRAQFYLGDYNYQIGKLDDAFRYALIGIEKLKNTQCQELAECYNLIGIIYSHKGDILLSLDSYLKGLDISINLHSLYLQAIIYNNIGCIYDNLEDNITSLSYFKKGLEAYIQDTNINYDYSFVFNMNIAMIECQLHNYNEADRIYGEALYAFYNKSNNSFQSNMKVVEYLLSKGLGYDSLKNKCLEELKEIIVETQLNIDSFKEIMIVCNELFNENDNKLEGLLDLLEKQISGIDVIDCKLMIQDMRIKCFKRDGKEKELKECLLNYREFTIRKTKEYQKLLIESANSKFIMNTIIKEAKASEERASLIQKKAQRDDLTKLYNRKAVKSIFEVHFNEIKNKNKPIGMAIIDIDYFKQYNDFYGHIAGDYCLKEIAAILDKVSDKNTYVMRYGGDEFLILFLDYSLPIMKSTLKVFESDIKVLNMEHSETLLEQKTVSITQGAYYGYATYENFLDYIVLADDALYEAKKMRNSIVVHSNTKGN